MMDPEQQPGFVFARMRLVKADFRALAEPEGEDQGELDVDYRDKVQVQGRDVILRQAVHVRVLNSKDPSQAYLDLAVEIEGTFAGSEHPNLDPVEFANNHAPAILFAFTREWVHKLSSAAAPWPPILLPPVNILQLRKQATAKSE
jgi:preprotein translocase subunit SecB